MEENAKEGPGSEGRKGESKGPRRNVEIDMRRLEQNDDCDRDCGEVEGVICTSVPSMYLPGQLLARIKRNNEIME